MLGGNLGSLLYGDVSVMKITSKADFGRAKFSAKFVAKVERHTIYCNKFSWDNNGFSILTDS